MSKGTSMKKEKKKPKKKKRPVNRATALAILGLIEG